MLSLDHYIINLIDHVTNMHQYLKDLILFPILNHQDPLYPYLQNLLFFHLASHPPKIHHLHHQLFNIPHQILLTPHHHQIQQAPSFPPHTFKIIRQSQDCNQSTI